MLAATAWAYRKSSGRPHGGDSGPTKVTVQLIEAAALAVGTGPAGNMTDEQARAACEAATRETGLPCTDPVRFPNDPAVLDATLAARERYLKTGRC